MLGRQKLTTAEPFRADGHRHYTSIKRCLPCTGNLLAIPDGRTGRTGNLSRAYEVWRFAVQLGIRTGQRRPWARHGKRFAVQDGT